MTTNAITEKPNQPADEWQSARELAPSQVHVEEPTVARWAGLIGLTFFAFGALAHLFSHVDWNIRLNTSWGTLLGIAGVALMLYHAASDGDIQVRRLYGVFGFIWLVLAIVISVLPIGGGVGSQLLPWGTVGFVLGLLFLLPFVHHETDPFGVSLTTRILGLTGGLLAVIGLLGGSIGTGLLAWMGVVQPSAIVTYLVPYGLVLALLGLAYLWAFIGLRGGDDLVGYRVGQAMAVAGFVAFLWAFLQWLGPETGYRLGWSGRPTGNYFADAGFLTMLLGLTYTSAAMMLCSDRQLAVLTRRELAGFFYSPIAYLVLIGFFLIATWRYYEFVRGLNELGEQGAGMMHVARFYVLNIFPVVVQILGVPLLTMRLFSEERRSGTYEVLVTAPVSEGPIVLSKFLAVLIVFLVTWLPFGLYMVALRVQAGPFDYHPMLAFGLALVCSGANFVAMGLFFSSLTRNQIASGVLTAGAMGLMIALYFAKAVFTPGSIWPDVIGHVSFIDLWDTTLQGRIPVGDLVLQLSFAAFWLFLTAKVVEARKWS
jgi:ABC-type transport system involved in multi-copper enzyme maturation permease subunit